MPFFSAFVPDAMATPPSVTIAESYRSVSNVQKDVISGVADGLSPYVTALSEDVLVLMARLAEKYDSLGDITESLNFKRVGSLGQDFELANKGLNFAKYGILVQDAVISLGINDEKLFVDAVDNLTREAVVDLAKFVGGKAGEVIGGAVGLAGGHLAPITSILGKICGGMAGEWIAENGVNIGPLYLQGMQEYYDTVIRETVRDAAGDLFRKYNGIGSPAGVSSELGGELSRSDLLPGITEPSGGGTTTPGPKGPQKPVTLNPVKIYGQ